MALGKENKLLFHIKEDLVHFKNITTGHPIIMGRKTFESIGRPLPNRTNIVISNSYQNENIIVVNNINDAIKKASDCEGGDEIFIIGGAQIYDLVLPNTDKLYLTIVENNQDGDVYFPEYKNIFKKEISREEKESEGYEYSFVELEK